MKSQKLTLKIMTAWIVVRAYNEVCSCRKTNFALVLNIRRQVGQSSKHHPIQGTWAEGFKP